MGQLNRFYTYAYLREDRTPYYIGKGKDDRAFYKSKGVRPPKDKSRIIFLKQNLTEEEAFRHEIYMIAVFGRKDLGTGILHNKTSGGEGSAGVILNEKARIRRSEMTKGKNNPSYGKKWWNDGLGNHKFSIKCPGEGWVLGLSEKHKRKISESNINPSQETRKKKSEAHKKLTHSKETKRKLSEMRKGENNPMYGKSPSEETRRKMSEANKGEKNHFYGKKHSSETRKRMSETRRGENSPCYGKKWWNDGCGNTKFSVECPGKNWVSGRGKFNRKQIV